MSKVEYVARDTDELKPATGRPRGRPRTASDADRRAGILKAALRLFQAEGYAGTTTEMVAAEARISKQTLYRLFPSKAELFRALVIDHRATMLELPLQRAGLPLDEAIAAVFRFDLSPEAEQERRAFVHLAMREGHDVPEIHAILREAGPDASRRMLAEWLAAQAETGAIVLEDADSAARMLMDMLFGAMLHFSDPRHGPPTGPARAARLVHLKRCVRTFLDGVRPRG
ncbi:TetR/AcrR family transcriptional regulator [Azorhizobium doebereinerae]|uniref:TetR/AcrR family transcriptional regulator n=1 Tax=Azorhizobium doebereinerae TaxID=281091 RepID=UPI0004031A3F|nr:TetR/AcrR family transcriptional regulator [Azorhizobium doebereinerae]